MPATEQVRTTLKKAALLKAYSLRANLQAACDKVHITRSTVRVWQEKDERFAHDFQQADLAATERLENEAWRRAVEGTVSKRTTYWHGEAIGVDEKIEYSDALLIMLLKARRPDVYREKLEVSVTQVVKAIGGVDPASVL